LENQGSSRDFKTLGVENVGISLGLERRLQAWRDSYVPCFSNRQSTKFTSPTRYPVGDTSNEAWTNYQTANYTSSKSRKQILDADNADISFLCEALVCFRFLKSQFKEIKSATIYTFDTFWHEGQFLGQPNRKALSWLFADSDFDGITIQAPSARTDTITTLIL